MAKIERDLKSKTEWIEMFPFGIALGVGQPRPVMIFKDKLEKRVLPVWLSPMDAGISVAQGNSPYGSSSTQEGSPHEISYKILEALGVRLEKCLFKRMFKHQQFVELHFVKQNPKAVHIIESKADDAISFCLKSGCKFFATVDYIEKSRVIEGEMYLSGSMKSQDVNPHPYLN